MSTNSTECMFIKEGDCCYARELFKNILHIDNITSYVCTRVLFDRGKMSETMFCITLLKSLHAYCSNSFQNQIYTGMEDCWMVHMCASSGECLYSSLDFARRLFDRGKEFDVLRSGDSVYELTLELGLCFDSLFKYLSVFLLVKNGDCGDARKLSDKLQLQVDILWTTNLSLQMPWQGGKIYFQMLKVFNV